MKQASTSDHNEDQADVPKRPWQFGLKHWFGFSAAVAFLLGFYVALYPFSYMALPLLIVPWVVLVVVLVGFSRGGREPRTIAVATMVAIAIYVAVGWGLSGVVDLREWSRKAQCVNNLKQLTLAMHNYHTAYGCFPPAYIADTNGRPIHSWRALLLPYVEQSALYQRYRWDEPWDGPNNRMLWNERVIQYECPEDRGSGGPKTSYVAVVGPETAWPGPTPAKVSDFPNGTSNTITVVEMANSGIHWMEPRDLDFASIPMAVCPKQGGGISSLHLDPGWSRRPLGVNAAMADGNVRWLSPDTPETELRALLMRSPGTP